MSFLCLKIALFLISYSNGSEEKRILLSDPQYIQQELTRFQSELQEMQGKYNAISSKNEAQNTELQSLHAAVTNLQNIALTQDAVIKKLQGGRGAVFTRWGRKDCPANTTTMVYSGYAYRAFDFVVTHPNVEENIRECNLLDFKDILIQTKKKTIKLPQIICGAIIRGKQNIRVKNEATTRLNINHISSTNQRVSDIMIR